MKTVSLLRHIFLILLVSAGLVSCGNDDSGNLDPGTARMAVRLVDDPGDYDHVYVDVQDVVIKYNGENDEVPIGDVNTGVYDLLELTGGVSVLLVEDELPAGTISQIRLILGQENSVVVDGETFPLATPSAQQSGLKLQVNETLEAGIFYEFILDFDVDESIVVQGNGGYLLKPVIRVATVAETGAISGQVLPANFQSEVTAVSGTTVISTFTDATGAFLLSGVPEGIYQVTIEADPAQNLDPIVIDDVEVTIGNETDIGTVEFP